MREEFLVKQILDAGLAVLLLLPGCEFLLEPSDCLLLCLDAVLIVILDVVEVGDGVLHRRDGACDRREYLPVVLHPQRSHQEYDWDCRGTRAWNLDHQHAIASLLDVYRLAHTVAL